MTRPHAEDGSFSALSTQHSALVRYRDLLLEANRTLNLTSVRDVAGVDRRHIAESIAIAHAVERAGLLPDGAHMIDVGSGGGLPGIPMAIVRPDLRVTLLEATGRKAAFLEHAVAALGLANVCVLAMRAEDAGHLPDQREAYDLAMARAVAPLAALAELTLPFVRIGGALAAVKGSRTEEEIAESGGAVERCGGSPAHVLSPTEGTADEHVRLVIVPKARATPPELPRRAGMPVKRPLR